MFDPYGALYIHIPFCKQRCLYCDFETEAVRTDDPWIESYAEQMVKDIRNAGKKGFLSSVKTVYFGGGTPTYVPKLLTQMLYTLSLSMHITSEVECSVEANPESLTPELVRDIWALGANRLSIGVQSFDDEVLQYLGRVHDAKRARDAITTAHERFENVSVDLMCGIPGQSKASFTESVRQAVELGVTHVSVYPLTVEPATPLFSMANKGQTSLPDPDVQAEHMEIAARELTQAGFERYEVASYAKPGYTCKHNIAYWTGVPYLGLGLSAVTMTQNSQRRMRKQHDQIIDDLDAKQMLAEDLMLRMRMSAGVSDELVAQAQETFPQLPEVFNRLEAQGLVVHRDNAWQPTERGWLCGNDLYGTLFDLAP